MLLTVSSFGESLRQVGKLAEAFHLRCVDRLSVNRCGGSR